MKSSAIAATGQPSLLAAHTEARFQPEATDVLLQSSLPLELWRSLRFEAGTSEELNDIAGKRAVGLTRRFGSDELREAVRSLDGRCVPAEDHRLVSLLTELKAICRQQNQQDGDIALSLAALAGRLRAYPAEIVEEVIRAWGDTETWYPGWADLKARCDLRLRVLLSVRDLLQYESGWGDLVVQAKGDHDELVRLATASIAAQRGAKKWLAIDWLEKRLERVDEEHRRRVRDAEFAERRARVERAEAEERAEKRRRQDEAAARGEPVFDEP